MKSALDVHRWLLAADVAHEVVRLSTTALSSDDLPRALGVAREDCVAVRLYLVSGARTADGSAVHVAAALVRPGDTPDEAALQAALGAATVAPATPDEISTHTGFPAQFVSPVCLPEDVAVLVDAAVSGRDVLYAATGEGGTALGMRTRDLLACVDARVAVLTPTRLPSPEWRTSTGRVGRVVDLGPRRAARRSAG